MYCGNCGKELKLGSKFCPNCGEPIPSNEAEIANEVNNELKENKISTDRSRINNSSNNFNKPKKSSNKILLIGALFLVLVLVGALFITNLFEYTKLNVEEDPTITSIDDTKSKDLDEEEENVVYSYDNYNVAVQQIDFNSFPRIKVYLSIEDKNTKEVPKNLDSGFFYIAERNANNEFIEQKIQKVSQLDQQENLNINMVADVSGSMANGPIDKAKNIMINFLDQVQFDIEDKVELTAFSTGVRTCATFTDNKELLRNEIINLKIGDQTALYDALFAAVNTTAVQDGAKCVLAFTDGQDNFSQITPEEVIQVANSYNVPIFIIGIGDSLDNAQLQDVASSTNGFYQQINDISDMSNIYEKIYRQNKEMYLLEYETQEKNDMTMERTLQIDVQTGKDGGGGTSYTFTPRILVSTQSQLNINDEISKLIGNFLRDYISAINNHNYSYIESYIVPGGGVEKELRPYIMNDIQEKLLSHEIINKEFIDDNTCIVTTRETYEVQNHEEPLHMRVLEWKYEVTKQYDGQWKILNYADRYKVLYKINY